MQSAMAFFDNYKEHFRLEIVGCFDATNFIQSRALNFILVESTS